MKPFAAQSFYELLEVSVSASSSEIRAAYERLDRLFGEGQNALYGLADAGHEKALRKRMREAVDVLTDDELRALYDQEIGLPPREPNPIPSPETGEGARRAGEGERQPVPVLELTPDPPAPIPSAPAPLSSPKVPTPEVVPNPATLVDEPPPQLAMGDLLANVDASVASTRPVAFTYERAGAAPPDPVSAIVPMPPEPAPLPPETVTPAVAVPPLPASGHPPPKGEGIDVSPPPAPPPAVVASPRPSVPGPRQSGPRIYSPRPSANALMTVSTAPRASAPSRPLAAELPKLPEIPPDAEFNGELLRTVRTALGISVPQLAERTRIGGKHIENVEADRYAALPASVYLRGILMSMAKELGLDGIRVARSYLKLFEAARPKG